MEQGAAPSWSRSRGLGPIVAAGLVVLTVGCASFQLPPYRDMVRATDSRTRDLSRQPAPQGPIVAAWAAAGRSQAEIKSRLEPLFEHSLRPSAIVNRSGLLATRYSQLDGTPGPMFQLDELVVRHLGSDTHVPYVAALHRGRRLPLVVGISGINGTVDGKITLEMLQALYDTGQFHVVHLQSVTSVNHQVQNQRPFLGGFPEGILLYQSLGALRGKYPEEIAQVHLLGVSYGGMLCGFAAHCEDKFQSGYVDGAVLAVSPPLDLKTLFDNLAVNRLIHDKVHSSYLEEGNHRYFQHGDFGVWDPLESTCRHASLSIL